MQLLSLAEHLHNQYCERHKIDYLCIHGDAEGWTSERQAFWQKVFLLRQGLELGYEYVIWLDADTLIVDHEADLRAGCPEDGIGCTWHTADKVPGGWPDPCYDHFCAGAVYIGNGEWSRHFVQRWWETDDQGHPWFDQHALNLYAEGIRAIDSQWNSIVPHFQSEFPVVMAWHGFGRSPESSVRDRFDAMCETIGHRFGDCVPPWRDAQTERRQPSPLPAMAAAHPTLPIGDAFTQAKALYREGRHGEAQAGFERILSRNPTEPEVLRFYCENLGAMGDVEGAEKAARRAVALDATSGAGYALLAGCLSHKGLHEEAGKLYEKALRLAPDMPMTHWNYALNLLMRGEYKRGWEEFRWGIPARQLRTRTLRPEWDGSPIPGKTLFLWAEWGFGDAIMMARFIDFAREKSQCARVVLECHEELVSLFIENGVADEVYALQPSGAIPWEWDEHCSLLNLPRILGIDSTDIAATKYLDAPALQLPGDGMLRVGVCTRGSSGHPNDRNRSTDPALWRELLQTAGCCFFNLDKVTSDLPMADWSQTAGLIASLDMVITVDTAVAHLAGAMGKPVWILLPFAGDFRWMTEREDSPWYPTARLFRQKALGEWGPVFEAAQSALWDATRNIDIKEVGRSGWQGADRTSQGGLLPFAEFEAQAERIVRAGTTRHAKLLYGLVRWLRPKRIVEVGTWHGYTAVWMARALQENGAGELYCIDDFTLGCGGDMLDGGGVLGILQDHISRCFVGEVISILPGHSSQVPWPEGVDLAYIDGDHSEAGCQLDINRAIEAGAQCIVFHDTVSWWGPRRCVERYRRFAEETGFDLIEGGFDEGLAVLMRPPEKGPETYTQEQFPTGAIEG